ncbi:hypothetical protein HRS9139_08125 [Pyrenophora teres f. teres]|nr:hypothetical protein HRS9139_08125 [Pyrenophora teres f. teres]
MGIIRAFEEWEPELMGSGHQVSVVTDHKNLEYFMSSKSLTRRQARWSIFLSQFDFKISYAPGEQNGEADALSRRPQDEPTDPSDPRFADTKIVLGPKVLSPGMQPAIQTALRALSTSSDSQPDKIRPEQRRLCGFLFRSARNLDSLAPSEPDSDLPDGKPDPTLPPYEQDPRPTEELLTIAYQNDPMAIKAFAAIDAGDSKLSKWFHKNGYYVSAADLTSLGEGDNRRLFIDRTRLYVPNDARLRRRIFDLCHDHEIAGHKGPRATLYLMYERYYWPGMPQSIATYCKACAVCKRTKSPRDGKHGYLRPLPIPHSRWSDLTVDYIQDLPPSRHENREYRNILVVVDRLTKRRHFYPTRGRTAAETASCFMDIFRHHGLPISITSDRGSNFVAPFWKRLCERLHIKRKLSTAYHPETDGQTERANQSLETFLRQFVNYAQDDWAAWLPIAEFQANDTVNSSTGMTPFFADLGYHPRSGIHPQENIETDLPRPTRDQIVRADEMMNSNADLVAHLKEQLRWAQQEQSAQANTSRHAVPLYQVGDKVWVSTVNWSTPSGTKKLNHRWAGPYTVTRTIHDGRAYELELPDAMVLAGVFPVFHPRLLRPANDEGLPDQAPPTPVEVQITDEKGDSHTEWLVDEFVDVRLGTKGRAKDRWQYKIKWTDYPKAEWYNAEDYLDHYDAFLFHWRHPEKPRPPGLAMPADWQPLPEDRDQSPDDFPSGDDSA